MRYRLPLLILLAFMATMIISSRLVSLMRNTSFSLRAIRDRIDFMLSTLKPQNLNYCRSNNRKRVQVTLNCSLDVQVWPLFSIWKRVGPLKFLLFSLDKKVKMSNNSVIKTTSELKWSKRATSMKQLKRVLCFIKSKIFKERWLRLKMGLMPIFSTLLI